MGFQPRPLRHGIRWTVIAIFVWAVSTSAQQIQPPVAGPNVNMVSGTQWPGGDPFLQRQNEPSLAVSSRNPFHLLAGANDYRSVDLALSTNGETGDAWVGLFKSLDGGATWRSVLLPGCPYNTPICAGAPNIQNAGYQAAADPTVRPGSNGMFYYSALVFNRGINPQSAIVVSRLIDLNNKENADPNDILNGDSIQYIGTSIVAKGSSSLFLDKPTMAVDIPRPGASSCRISVNQPGNGTVRQSFAAGTVYVTYTAFQQPPGTDPAETTSPLKSKLYFARSTNCGATWSTPVVISAGSTISQGASIAIDPNTGVFYVVWRQFQHQSSRLNEPDAIMVAASADSGISFSSPQPISTFTPFDEGTTDTSFRTNAYPTIAIDQNSRIYVAYSARNTVPSGDARIVLTSSIDGQTWSTPQVVDDPPIDPVANPSGRGHQIMPALSFAGGMLSLLYYDLRLDHAFGTYTPLLQMGEPTGLYSPATDLAGELSLNPPDFNAVFNLFIDDSSITLRRHTFDLRLAQAIPGAVPAFSPSVLVSQYAYGCCAADQTDIEQMQFNAPNLPLFKSGTAPFMGDYVDLAPGPLIVGPQASREADYNPDADADDWQFNVDASTPTVLHAAWTDNRDVQAPPNGDWTQYTPPISPSLSATSIFQPGATVPACRPGYTSTRNQNIYTAPISDGLIFGAPSNSKTLGTTVFNGQTVPFQRAFVVLAQNTTQVVKSFRLTIANQPPGGSASFLQFDQLSALDLSIPPLSSATRPVFVVSTDPRARVAVTITEITAPQGVLVPNGLTGSTILNADPTNPAITNPAITNPGITNPAITNFEVTNPAITNPAITNPAITNPAITNPGITNPGITNTSFQNESVVNPGITNPAITNPAITNPSIATPGITNPAITNVDPDNVSIADTQWTVTNTGNTTGAYTVNLASSSTVPPQNFLQLIISKLYQTPAAPTGQSCNLGVETHNQIVTNIVNPTLLNPANPGITNPGITNPAITNATVSLAPGESANIDIRVTNLDKQHQPTFDPATSVVPVTVSQSVNTAQALASGGTGTIPPPPISVPPLMISNTALPDGVVGVVYAAAVTTQGGNPTTHTFAVAVGALPPGLTLDNAAGSITGVPTTAGAFTFTIQVQDVGSAVFPQNTATQTFNINIVPAPTGPPALTFTANSVPSGVAGRSYSQQLPVTGGTQPYTASLTAGGLPPGIALSGAMLTGAASRRGTFTFTASVTDSSTPPQTAVQTITLTVNTLVITTTVLPGGIVGVPYNAVIATEGGTLPLSFSLPTAEFPPGLKIQPPNTESSTGALVGTPILPGTYTFSESVTDSSENQQTATQRYVVSIAPPGTAVPANVTFVSQPQNSAGGQTLAGSPIVVKVTDAGNAPIAGASVALNFNGAPPCAAAVLGGTVSAVTDASGQATFANLSVDRGQLGYTLQATTGNAGAVSTAFTVSGFCPAKAPISVPREVHSAVTLLDGTVLVAGGGSRLPGLSSPGLPVASAELYDPSTGMFSATGSMNVPRWGQTTTPLRDGRVLIAGGVNSSTTAAGSVTNTAEIYDPATHTFALTNGLMNSARFLHTATLLADGRVLLAGGGMTVPADCIICFGVTTSNTAEVFDPATGLFTPTSTPLTVQRQMSAATLMPNGQVLLAGGLTDGPTFTSTASAEVFDPVSNGFRATSSMTAPRVFHDAALLPNGKVLVAGGGFSGTAAAELYDPATGTFAATGNLVGPSGLPAIVLTDGTVLLSFQNAQVYNASTGVFTATGGLVVANNILYGVSLLHDGTVLTTGGETLFGTVPEEGTITDADIYYSTAPLAPLQVTTPTATAPVQPGTTVFTDPIAFAAATNGAANTEFNGIIPPGSPFASFSPLVLNGITFSTPMASQGVFVDLTSATFYSPHVYPRAFITNSVMSTTGQSSPNNTLVITLSGPATAFAMDFGGLGFRGASSATITLSNGFVLPLSSLPTVGSTEFRGFVSTTPFNTITFTTVNDDFVVLDVLVAGAAAVLPPATVGKPYTQILLEQGGLGTLTWTLASGALPPGVTLSSNGILLGAPTLAGTFTFSVHLVDSSTPPKSVTSGTFVLPVAGGGTSPLVFGAQTLPTGFTGTVYGATLTASGGTTPYNFAVTGGTLPNGITLASSGSFSGTPTAIGSFTFTVTATDSSTPPQTASQSFTINVANPLLITTTTLPNGTPGTTYSFVGVPFNSFTGISCPPSCNITGSFTVAQPLPPNINLSASQLSGSTSNFTPISFSFTDGVTTATNQLCPTDNIFDANTDANGNITQYSISLCFGHVGKNFFFFYYPPNVTQVGLNGSNNGNSYTVMFGSGSGAPGGTWTMVPSYSVLIGSSGGQQPVSFAVTGGTLPPGLTLSTAGVLSGAPTTTGTFTFTITATDSSTPPAHASQTYTVTIASAMSPTLVSVNPNAGFQGQQNLSVAITGQATHFTQGTTVANFGSGVQVQSLTVASPTTATAVVNIAAAPNAGINLNFFPNTAYNANTATMDATLGTTGYTIDSFETTTLIPGLSIQLSGGVTPTTWTSLPNLFDGDTACPGTASGQAWDGTDTASNQIANQLTSCTSLVGAAALTTFNYAPGATSFGIGLSNFQSVNPPSPEFPITNHELFVNGVDMGVLETLAGAAWSPGLTRNAYLRIDAANGGVITSVGFENLASNQDFLMFDHLAVLPSGTPATRDVTMTTSTEVATLTNGFSVNTNPSTILFSNVSASIPPGSGATEGSSSGGSYLANAFEFSPTATGTFTDARIDLWANTANGAVTASLYSDAGGTPGALLAQLDTTTVPFFSTLPSLSFSANNTSFTQTSGPGVTLAAGSKYWLALTPGNATSFVLYAIGGATASVSQAQQASPGGPWAPSGLDNVQIEIDGTVNTNALVFGAQTLPTGITGTVYTAALTASGGRTPYTFAVITGTLPPGITLATNGTFSGTPTTAGSSTFTVRVADSSSPAQTASQSFTINVVAPLVLSTTTLSGGTAGTAYNATLSTTGGTPPVSFAVTSGTLPPALTLASSGPQSAALSGTPTTPGTFTFTITATDSSTPPAHASQSYTVTIAQMASGVPGQIKFVSQPTGTTAGQPITPAVTVQVVDTTGFPLLGVTVTIGTGSGTNQAILSGTLWAVTDSTGTATFSNIVTDRAGTGLSLVASLSSPSTSGAIQLTGAPASVMQGALENDTQMDFFGESAKALPSAVSADITGPGSYASTAALTPGTIPSGTQVNSYYIHADPIGISQNVSRLLAGEITFPTDVLGVIVTDANLNASDAVAGLNSTTYPTSARGPRLNSPTDTVIVSSDRRTVTLHLSVSSATDDVRVITAANTGASLAPVTSASFNTLAATGSISTVAGSTWVFPGGGLATSVPIGLGADIIYGTAGIATDSSGNVYFADPDGNMVFKLTGTTLSVVAGTGVEGYAGDGRAATNARLDFPSDVAISPTGESYVADYNNSVIRKINSDGIITTVVGNGIAADSGDGGPASSASLDFPLGIAFDAAGDLYIAELSGAIRKVNTSGIISTMTFNSVPGVFTGFACPQLLRLGPDGLIYVPDQCLDQVLKFDSAGNVTIVGGSSLAVGPYSGDGGPATSAALNWPGAVAFDTSGDIFIADEENHAIRKVNAAGTISTVAGNGTPGFAGDGTMATLALLNQPGGLAFDSSGNLFIADTTNERIRRIDSAGTITTVAGNGRFKYAGDGGQATSASLDSPPSVAVDTGGNLFAADIANLVVRKVNPAGLISTYVGTGVTATYSGYSGDGGPAASATITYPSDVQADGASDLFLIEGDRIHKVAPSGIISTPYNGESGTAGGLHIALDSQGNVYFVARNLLQVLKLDTTGAVTVVAGTGARGFSGDAGPAASATFGLIRGLAVDSAGNLFVADNVNGRVRRVDTSGIITTVAGNGSTTTSGDGGPAASAGVPGPWALVVDGAGNLYVSSASSRIRKVDAAGTISTIAGGGFIGSTVDGVPASNATFNVLQGLAFDAEGSLYVGDRFDDRVRKITGVTNAPPFIFNPPSGLTVATKGLPHGIVGTAYLQTVSAVGGSGSYTWSISSGSLPTGLSLSSAGAISGTPTTAGASTFIAKVADSSGATATQSITLTIVAVASPPKFTSAQMPSAISGGAYSQVLPVTGGVPPYTFSLVALGGGAGLPTGLAFNANTGLVSGTTTALGTYRLFATVTDSSIPSQTAAQTLTLTVVAPLAIITTTLPNGMVGAAYNASVLTSGGSGTVTETVTTGALPPGLTLSSAGLLSGTPTVANTFTFTVTATDQSIPPQSALQSYTVTISGNSGIPAQVVFAVQPQNSIAGQPMENSIQVEVLDANFGLVPGVTVTLKFNGAAACPKATINGGASVSAATNSVGIATFSGVSKLTIDRGHSNYTLSATAGSITTVSNPFNVEGFCSTATPSSTRYGATATLLQNGKVLLAGGQDTTAGVVVTAEIYDPIAGTMTPTGSMNVARLYATSTLLNDGTVLIAGGTSTAVPTPFSNPVAALPSAEIYNPATGQFTLLTVQMSSARVGHTATLLNDGTVLIAGGSIGGGSGTKLNTAEIYNPAAQTFTLLVATMNDHRESFTATLLPSGKVLLAGGMGMQGQASTTADIYDPASKMFAATSPMVFAHAVHSATLLLSGLVAIIGGVPPGASSSAENAIELFNPNTNTFQLSIAELSPTPRAFHTATPLLDGRVLIAGGFDFNRNAQSSAETFNNSEVDVPSSDMQSARAASTATLLQNQSVLFAGGTFSGAFGNQTLATQPAEIFYPATVQPFSITTSETFVNVDSPLSFMLQTSGGNGKDTWQITSGALPSGVTLSSSGLLSGTPTVSGDFVLQVQVADSSTPANITSGQLILVVSVPQLFVGSVLPDANPGVAYSQPITVFGGSAPYNFALVSGALPTGLTLAANGVVSGTATTTGTSSITVQVTDSTSPPISTQQTVKISVAPALAITTASLPNGVVGSPYSATVTTIGGVAPLTFSGSGIPPGLTLSSAGVLSGTPTTSGTFQVFVLAEDSSASVQVAQQTYTIGVTGTPVASMQFVNLAHQFSSSGGVTASVLALDASSNPVSNTTINLSVSTNPCSAEGTSGSSAVTDATGTASFGIDILGGGFGFVLKATSFNNVTATSGTFNVSGACDAARPNAPRYAATTTVLNSGQVLVAGGVDGTTGTPVVSATAEVYNPATATFSLTGSMTVPRTYHTATLLPNGNVLIVGGVSQAEPVNIPLASVEIYNPGTGAFTALGSMSAARFNHTATLLSDGTVLVAGGNNGSGAVSSAEIISPTAGTITLLTNSMNAPREMATGTLMANGTVLIAGGLDMPRTVPPGLATAEIYNPANLSFTLTNPMNSGHAGHTATLLTTGQVLIVGGENVSTTSFTPNSNVAELFDPSSGTFTLTGSLFEGRAMHTATLLQDSKVLIADGNTEFSFLFGGGTFEVYDPSAGTFTLAGSPIFSRGSQGAALLGNGSVLLVGGSPFVEPSEIYYPAVSPVVFLTNALPNGANGSPYSANVLTTGGFSPVTFQVTSGSLPPGLTLSPQGVLSGTPSALGTVTFSITATDSSSVAKDSFSPQSTTHAFTLIIN